MGCVDLSRWGFLLIKRHFLVFYAPRDQANKLLFVGVLALAYTGLHAVLLSCPKYHVLGQGTI